MELFKASDANAMITTITGAITANMPAIVLLMGFFIGIKIARGFVNRSVSKGKV